MGGTLCLRIAEVPGNEVAGLVVVNGSLATPPRWDAQLAAFLAPVLSKLVAAVPGIASDIKAEGVIEGAGAGAGEQLPCRNPRQGVDLRGQPRVRPRPQPSRDHRWVAVSEPALPDSHRVRGRDNGLSASSDLAGAKVDPPVTRGRAGFRSPYGRLNRRTGDKDVHTAVRHLRCLLFAAASPERADGTLETVGTDARGFQREGLPSVPRMAGPGFCSTSWGGLAGCRQGWSAGSAGAPARPWGPGMSGAGL